MARTSDEVLVGTGTLYTAAVGTAFPADPSTAPAGAWLDIGYSEEGWTFAIDRTFEDVEVAEEVDPVKILKTAQDIFVRGAAAQGAIETLKLAMAGGTITTAAGPPATKTYVPPAATAFDEKALLLRVNAPTAAGVAKTRDIQIPRGICVGAIEMAHAKAPAKVVVGIEFRVIKPTTGDIFKVVDLT